MKQAQEDAPADAVVAFRFKHLTAGLVLKLVIFASPVVACGALQTGGSTKQVVVKVHAT